VTKLNQEVYSFVPDHPFLVTQTHTAVTLTLPAYQSDQSFDITSRSFDEPEVLQENSIQAYVGAEASNKSKLPMVLPRDVLVLSPSGWQFWQINAMSFDWRKSPEVLQENSIQEDTSLPNISTASITVTYSIIPEGTEKGKEKLVDTLGHTYTKKVSKHFHL
jgi:hypothetical protein